MLFGKLQQGVQENQQILTIARLRAEAEELYGAKLGDVVPATDRISGGFSRDEGASVRKVRSRLNKADRDFLLISCTCRLTKAFEPKWKTPHEITRK